jgi:2-phosphosulfolactate phosphatase
VVIDILRATTTIATALDHGARGIRAFADLDLLQESALAYGPGTCLKAGERGGKAVKGFEMSNSPFEYTPERVQGKWILMSTTNGTRALTVVQGAPVVITAAFVNLTTVREFLKREQFETLWIVSSGWEGSYSLEDSCCAGALCDLGTPANDEAVAAQALYQQWQGNLLGMLHQASHGKRLLGLGCDKDLAYCSEVGILDILPRQNSENYLVGTKLWL